MKRQLKLKIVCSILLAMSVFATKAQLYNRVFEQNDTIVPNDTQSLHLHFEMLNFLRNTEYFDLIESGQTYFGSLIQAHLSYQPYKNVLLKGGIQMHQDFGSTGYRTVQPVFTISIFKGKWRYNFGAMQGTTNYGFIEPMYNIDRAITNRIENGIQNIYRSKTFYFNQFLVWNEPTYRTSTNQEKFTTGLVTERLIYDRHGIHAAFPLQATLAHRGGQLNDNPTPIYTRINGTVGLKLNYTFPSGFRIRTENYWLASGDFSPNITQPYKNGFASWHTLSFMRKNIELMFNYWAGREWQSPVGTQIYNNYNVYTITDFRQVRHMLMSRLLYTRKLNNMMFLDLRLEPFYDFEYKKFQYSYSAYIKIKLDKIIGKI